MKLNKTLDKQPIVVYKGRKIEIISSGAYHNTNIFIDGKRMQTVHKLILKIVPNEVVTVEMEVFDI